MQIRHRHIPSLLSATLALALATPTTFADSPTLPFSYKKPTPDGRHVFVMIAPWTVENDVRRWNEETAAGIRAIRATYTRSGLYRNDGSTAPLWTVDWYAHDVDVASDAVHLVRHGPWASSTQQEAFGFFANGKLVRSYRIAELVDIPWLLPRSVSHFQWSDGGLFDDSALQYAVSTKDGNSFVFNVVTGEIVSASRTARIMLWTVVTLVATIVGAMILGWSRRRRRAKLRQAADA